MTQDNLIALKPCPFCGGEAALSEGGGKHVTYVFCSRVGCSAEMSASLDPALAKAKWNTRTIERPPAGQADNLIARLRKAADEHEVARVSGYNVSVGKRTRCLLIEAADLIERLSLPSKAKPRRKKEGPCGCDVDPFGCERHPS